MQFEMLKKQVVADFEWKEMFPDKYKEHMVKWCVCSATPTRIRLFFDHTWEEYCPKCGAKSPRFEKDEK